MFLDSLQETFGAAFIEVWAAFMSFVPLIIGALIVCVVGILVARLLGAAVTRLLNLVRFNDTVKVVGFGDIAHEWGIEVRASEWLGDFVEWFTLVVFFLAALSVLQLDTVTFFLEDIIYTFLPKVCIAIVIMGVALVIGEFARKVVQHIAHILHIRHPKFLAHVAEWAVLVFAAFAALSQIGIAEDFIKTLFTGLVVALSLAFGLSFGIGGQRAAADFIEDVRQTYRNR
jgi:hypothetical protein